jgi:hypothetical protein
VKPLSVGTDVVHRRSSPARSSGITSSIRYPMRL